MYLDMNNIQFNINFFTQYICTGCFERDEQSIKYLDFKREIRQRESRGAFFNYVDKTW